MDDHSPKPTLFLPTAFILQKELIVGFLLFKKCRMQHSGYIYNKQIQTCMSRNIMEILFSAHLSVHTGTKPLLSYTKPQHYTKDLTM